MGDERVVTLPGGASAAWPTTRRVRDNLIIDQAFLEKHRGDLHLAARTIVIKGAIKPPQRELILMADHLDVSGWIDVSGQTGSADKVDGDNGLDGVPDDNRGEIVGAGQPEGRRGGDGQPGRSGTAGRNLRIYAHRITGLMGINARGGPGGRGGNGGDGGVGVQSNAWHGYGGSGGDGNRGGDGGAGGDVTIVADGSWTVFAVHTGGGRGGFGGRGGTAGLPITLEKGWIAVGDPPVSGRRGDPGKDAPDGRSRFDALADGQLYARAASDVPDLARAWGEYRARRAEWLFRTMDLADDRMQEALSEANASAALQPRRSISLPGRSASPFGRQIAVGQAGGGRPILELPGSPGRQQADRVRSLISAGQSPLGLPWKYEPAAGFEYYDGFVENGLNALRAAVAGARQYLLADFTASQIRDMIVVTAEAAKRADIVAADEVATVVYKQNKTKVEQEQLEDRWKKNAKAIEDRKEFLRRHPPGSSPLDIFHTLWDIATFVSALWGNVAAVPGLVNAFVKVGNLIDTSGRSVVEDVVDFSKKSPSLRPEAKQLFDDVSSFFDKSKKVFDASKAIKKLAEQSSDETIAALLKEQAGLVLERGKIAVQAEQEALEFAVVAHRKEGTELVSREALRVATEMATATHDLRDLALRLVLNLRAVADKVHSYHFQALRALQRWTFDQSQPRLSFAFGWVDPDLEADLQEAGPGEEIRSALLDYLGAVEQSAGLDYGDLERRYEESIDDAKDARTIMPVHVKVNAAARRKLSAEGAATFDVTLDMIPEKVRRECHVEAVVALLSPLGAEVLVAEPGPDWTAVDLRSGAVVGGADDTRRPVAVPLAGDATSLQALIAETTASWNKEKEHPQNTLWGSSAARQWKLKWEGGTAEAAAPSKLEVVLLVTGHALV